MTYVTNEHCLGERYATCVDVCPVNCMYPGEYKGQPFLVIDPEVCIDCGACLPECPIQAIQTEDEASQEWLKINAELSPQFKSNPAVDPRPANDPPRRQH